MSKSMRKITLVVLLGMFVIFRGWGQSASEVGFLNRSGQPAPDFKVSMLNGEILDTKDLRGKVILLDFWGAKCGGCLLEMKRFPEDILKPYGKRKDFFLLPVEAQGHSVAEIKAVAERLGFDFPLAYENGQDIAGKFFNRKMGLPRTIIIDRKGKIVYQAFGYTEEEFNRMLKVLEKTLKNN